MRARERWEYLSRAPLIGWDLIARGQHRFEYDLMPVAVRGMSAAARLNLLRSGLNLFWRRNKPWGWPLHMQVELTSYCELQCPVCPAGTGELERDAKSIDVALVEQLMQEVGEHLLTVSLWGWGEPLLHKRLERILEITSRYPCAKLLSTNGQQLNHPRVQQALRAHPPTYLIVAVDGLCDETNSVYRRGAKLQPLLDGVRALAEWKRSTGATLPILHCRFIAMRHNEHELPALPQFCTDAGFDMATVRTLSIVDTPVDRHNGLIPASELLRAYSYQDNQRARRSDFVCQHAFTFPTLMADGRLVSCEQDHNCSQAYGTLKPGVTFSDLWRSDRASSIRRTIKESPEKFSFCRNCPYADRPTSSCSIQSLHLRPGIPGVGD
ncbi:radical SAM protein [uncultured Paludibaculum sp.]|uniref:radical SAM/SPASM domain-containing protein n=1 Tax=uncultured Paludibaculum sp. TaxID=1765020 RepID=UPI002AAA9096|nr:radical SAM protein [uncultured Paludibaculum sp.]